MPTHQVLELASACCAYLKKNTTVHNCCSVLAAADTVQLIQEAQQFKPDIRAAFVINRKIANTAIGRDVTTALSDFEDVPVLPVALHQRVIYAESAAQGLSVIEADMNSDAAREVGQLVTGLFNRKEKKVA